MLQKTPSKVEIFKGCTDDFINENCVIFELEIQERDKMRGGEGFKCDASKFGSIFY